MMVTKKDVGSLTEKRSSFSCVDWRVLDFFSGGVRKNLESPSFHLADSTWHFVIYPLDTNRDTICLRLKEEEPDNGHCGVEFTLSVHDIDEEIYTGCQFRYDSEAKTSEWNLSLSGKQLIADKEKLSGNGCLHVRCLAHIRNINLVEKWSQTSWDNDSESMNQDIADLFFKEKNADITFEVEGLNFKAHKSILSARSPVFSAIFSPSMRIVVTDFIKIPGFTSDAFRDFLVYLYTATVDEFSIEKALSLYPIARTYNVSQLMQKCVTFMINKMSVDTFCDVLALALRYNETALIEAGKNYFAEHALGVVVTLKWQSFHKDNCNIARKLFIKYLKREAGEYTVTTALHLSTLQLPPRKTVGCLTERHGPSYSVEWKIAHYFSQAPIVNELWISPILYLYDTSWTFDLYPNGFTEKANAVGFFLQKQDLSPRLHSVQCNLGLKSSDGTIFKPAILSRNINSDCGTEFVETSEIFEARSMLAPDGIMTFSCVIHCLDACKMDAMTETYLVGGAVDVEILNKDIADLFLKKQNADVIIKVGDLEFKAHKSILASRSSAFAAMFDHDMQECRECVINIEDCNAAAFRSFLQYLYAPKLDEFSTEKAVYLYRFADKYNVKQLMLSCVKFLKNNFSSDTFCDVLQLALEYNEKALINAANMFFTEKAEDILNTLKWQLFHEENHTVANELFIKCLNKFAE